MESNARNPNAERKEETKAMTLKEKAEMHLGAVISEDAYKKALPLAEQKLKRINERYGTNHGEDYLAMLISEQVQFRVFSDFCGEMHRAKAAEQKAKKRWTHRIVRPPQPTNIIARTESYVKREF